MTYQISIKDVREAIANMTSNRAELVCSEKPRIALSIEFLTKEDGCIYTKTSYQVGKDKVELSDNMPIKVLVRDFNAALQKFDQERE